MDEYYINSKHIRHIHTYIYIYIPLNPLLSPVFPSSIPPVQRSNWRRLVREKPEELSEMLPSIKAILPKIGEFRGKHLKINLEIYPDSNNNK